MSARQNGLRCYSKRYYYSHLYMRYLSRQKSDILFSSTSVKEFELIALCIPLLFSIHAAITFGGGDCSVTPLALLY